MDRPSTHNAISLAPWAVATTRVLGVLTNEDMQLLVHMEYLHIQAGHGTMP